LAATPISGPVPFADIVNLLRSRYATNKSAESMSGLETMTREDVVGLAQCFTQDLENAVNKARRNSGAEPLPKAKSQKEKISDLKRAGNSASVTELLAATPALAGSGGSSSGGPPTGFLGAVQPSSIVNIKDAMVLLRNGCEMTKFSNSRGTPSVRIVKVMDRRAVHQGEMVLMPHFCWCVGDSEPSNQLALIELRDVRTGPSQDMRRNEQGYIVDYANSIVQDSCCFTCVFPQRKVMLAAPTAQHAAVWVKCLLLVVDKNRTIRRR
jgi:hypothetical protein